VKIESLAASEGGRVTRTEIIGLMPDELALAAAADRFRIEEPLADRLLSRRLVPYLAALPGQTPSESE